MSTHDDARPHASPRAVARLGMAVGGEVAQLRTTLRAAVDEADRLEAGGRPDLAVEVLEAQRDVLAQVHERLSAHVSAAAVEREAEQIVTAIAPVEASSLFAAPMTDRPLPSTLTPTGPGRLLASALAAVLGLAMLLSAEAVEPRLSAAGIAIDGAPTPADVAAAELPTDAHTAADAVLAASTWSKETTATPTPAPVRTDSHELPAAALVALGDDGRRATEPTKDAAVDPAPDAAFGDVTAPTTPAVAANEPSALPARAAPESSSGSSSDEDDEGPADPAGADASADEGDASSPASPEQPAAPADGSGTPPAEGEGTDVDGSEGTRDGQPEDTASTPQTGIVDPALVGPDAAAADTSSNDGTRRSNDG